MTPRRTKKRRERATALMASLALSALLAPLLWLGGVTALRPGEEEVGGEEEPAESEATEPRDFEVVSVFEPPEQPPVEPEALAAAEPEPVEEEEPDDEPEEETPEPEPTPEEVVEVEESEPEPPPPAEPEPDNRQSVVQHESNDQPNPFAEYLAEQDNRVLEETMAEDTVMNSDESGNEQAGELEEVFDDAGAEEVFSEELAAVDIDTEEMQVFETEGDPETPESADVVEEPIEVSEEIVEPTSEDAAASEAEAAAVPDELLVPLPTVANLEQLEVENDDGEFVQSPLPSEATPSSAMEELRLGAAFERSSELLEQSNGRPTPVAEVAAVNPEVYNEVFGARDANDHEHLEELARESQLVGDHEGRWERTRASMENFGVDVRTGTETHLNTQSSAYATYISYIHNKIHPRFEDFIFTLEFRYGPTSPLADPSLHTQILYVIASDGEVEDVQIMSSSGSIIFDGTIVDMLYDIGPHEPPPAVFLSSNGNAYIEWNFHRNQRMCGTFGAFPRFVGGDDPVDEGK